MNKLLSIFLTCGYPDMKTTEKLIYLLDKIGVDIIELGIPFSDPIADGPLIQYSSHIALKNKVNLDKVFRLIKKVNKRINVKLVIMSYLNIIYRYGFEKFFNNCKQHKIWGLIIPDLIPEESFEIRKIASKYRINIIFLLAPTTDFKRRKIIYKYSEGFIYVVSVTGVTGIRKRFSYELKNLLIEIKKETKKTILLGFGISKPAHIFQLRKYVDGFIIGSAIVNIILKNKKNFLKKIEKFIKEIIYICHQKK